MCYDIDSDARSNDCARAPPSQELQFVTPMPLRANNHGHRRNPSRRISKPSTRHASTPTLHSIDADDANICTDTCARLILSQLLTHTVSMPMRANNHGHRRNSSRRISKPDADPIDAAAAPIDADDANTCSDAHASSPLSQELLIIVSMRLRATNHGHRRNSSRRISKPSTRARRRWRCIRSTPTTRTHAAMSMRGSYSLRS